MKIPAIKLLVESHSVEELQAAENALMEGKPIGVNAGSEDEGEQLTHILAAIWIKQEMAKQSIDYNTALRQYTKKVRDSIS